MSGDAAQTRYTHRQFALRWTAAMLLGYVAGIEIVLANLAFTEVLGVQDLVFGGSWLVSWVLIGVCTAFFQWSLTLRDRVQLKTWIATGAAVSLGTLAGAFIGSRASDLNLISDTWVGGNSGMQQSYTLSGSWLITVLFLGVTFGAGVGLPQWVALRRAGRDAWLILAASLAASLVVLLSFISGVVILGNDLLAFCPSCCLSPIIFGVLTGLAVSRTLHLPPRSKNNLEQPPSP
jgi:hypothetical protein